MSYSQSGNISSVSSGSMFTPSELALIQAGKWLPELSHFVPVTSPRNLDDNLNHARDEGEKIDLLIHTALNPHAPALIGLGEFLNSRDLTILAATLRGFASIGETLKQQNLDPNYRHHLEQLKYVLTANLDLHDDENPSVHLFKRLCQDAESGGSEMVRWAAAHALQELDYPLNLRRQLLSRPPAEIEAEIWTKYEMRLSESNRQRDPSKVLEDVKFGIYGDTKKLFAKCDAGYSLEIARQVLQKSGVRGIKLAIESRNKPIVQAAINFAGELFNQNHYKDNATRQKLADLLLPFLNQADFDLRNLAAEKLNDKKNQYDVSNRFIDQNNRAKVAVIDTDWKRAISLGDLAISILRQAVGGTLRIEQTENLNVNCQIAAVKAIDKILTAVSRKVSTLSPYLQHDDDEVRQEVANLLQPIQSHLDMASTQILTALLFTMNLPYNSNINSLDKSTVESCLRNIENHKQNIRDIFEKATSACANNSTSTRNFLSKQKEFLLNRVSIYSSNLNIILKKFTTEFDIQKICEKIDRNHSLKTKYSKQLKNLDDKCSGIRISMDYFTIGLIFYTPVFAVFAYAIQPVIAVLLAMFLGNCDLCITFIRYGVAESKFFFALISIWCVVNLYLFFMTLQDSNLISQQSSIWEQIRKVDAEVNSLQWGKDELERKLPYIERQIKFNP